MKVVAKSTVRSSGTCWYHLKKFVLHASLHAIWLDGLCRRSGFRLKNLYSRRAPKYKTTQVEISPSGVTDNVKSYTYGITEALMGPAQRTSSRKTRLFRAGHHKRATNWNDTLFARPRSTFSFIFYLIFLYLLSHLAARKRGYLLKSNSIRKGTQPSDGQTDLVEIYEKNGRVTK